MSKTSAFAELKRKGMIFNFILQSERLIKPTTERILSNIEELVRLCMNLKQKSRSMSSADGAAVTSPSLPSSYFLLLSLWHGCAKNIPLKTSTTLNFTVRLSHDSSDMYVYDAAARKDRLLLTFTSAVGCYCHSNTVMLMLERMGRGIEGARVAGWRKGGGL